MSANSSCKAGGANGRQPKSDKGDYFSHHQSTGERGSSMQNIDSTNNRSRPEYQVHDLSSESRENIDSHGEFRRTNHEPRYGGHQQSRALQESRSMVQSQNEYHPRENGRSIYNNPYDDGVRGSGSKQFSSSPSNDDMKRNPTPHADDAAIGRPRVSKPLYRDLYIPPRARRERSRVTSNDRGKPVTYDRSSGQEGSSNYSTPQRSDGNPEWEPLSDGYKPSVHEKQRKFLREGYQGYCDDQNQHYATIEKDETPEARVGPLTLPWKYSYSTMRSVPVPSRDTHKSSHSGSHSRSLSGPNTRDKVSHESKSGVSERKQLQLKAPKSNPYASKKTKSFTDIKIPRIFIKALTDMDFMQPTHIQAHALPLILDTQRYSVMGHAKAGSGKTAAFGIGMLYWSSTQNERCEALAICPTRELAIQVHEVVVRLAKFTQHGIFLAVPGCDNRSQITDAVVIGTPGKIYYDVLGGRELENNKQKQQSRYPKRALIDSEHVRILVIDEADHLLTKQGGLSDIVLKCRKILPRDAQVLCFSATFDAEAREFVNVVAPGATLVEVQPSKQEQEAGKRIPGGINSLKIKHIMAKCNGEQQKYECLSDMFGYFNIGQALIFVQTTNNANSLSRKLKDEGYQVGIIHGKMPKQVRDAVMEDFRAGKLNHLISSNLLARGIDIPNISVVINYDVPIGKHVDQYGRTSWGPDVDIYVHRAGRAGRFGRNGACITLIHDQSSFKEFWSITTRLEEDYGLKIKQVDADSLETIEEDVNSHLAS